MKKILVFLMAISIILLLVFGIILIYSHFFKNSSLKDVDKIIESICGIISMLSAISICILTVLLKKIR